MGALFFCFIEDTADHIGAFLLLGLIQMGIDIRRCGQIGMTEEGRYIQQRNILIDEDAGEGVSEVVKANVPQTVLLQQLAEIGGNASGVEDIAHGIHKNIAVILFAVAISAYPPILLLLLPQRQQLFPDVADQRQGAQAGFRLGREYGCSLDASSSLSSSSCR